MALCAYFCRGNWQLQRRVWAFTLLALTLSPFALFAQPLDSTISFVNRASFRIPFELEGGSRRVREVILFVSEDRGLHWQRHTSTGAEQTGLPFRAERDGLYYFTVQTIDADGRSNPPTVQGALPMLKVFVDTRPPEINLQPIGGRDGNVGVAWDIREENLDLSSFSLEYRYIGNGAWSPLAVDAAPSGQRTWNPAQNAALEIRLRVRDLAKNEAEKHCTVTPGTEYTYTSNPREGTDRTTNASAVPDRRWVNSKRVSLNYEIQDKGPSGISAVELWVSNDLRTWSKYSEDKTGKPPLVVDLAGEGIYGLALVVRNGVGVTGRAPRSGEPPQMVIEVDLTPPVVEWVNADVGRGSDAGYVTITWKASDKNLGQQPISISYSKDGHAPWVPIVSNFENTGRYRWRLGEDVPFSFFIRLEATDRAGNVGHFDTPKAVIVDLHEPKGLILDAGPAKDRPNSGFSDQ
jgi:hypothetical protein